MIAYTLKNILELVPDVLPHVKSASIEQDFPTDSRDSAIASALSIEYHKFVDKSPVDFSTMEKVASAVSMYGVANLVSEFSGKLIKQSTYNVIAAHATPVKDYHIKVAGFQGNLSGYKNVESLQEEAEDLYKEALDLGVDVPEQVSRYSANAFLSKEAAVRALAARYQASSEVGFAKIAASIGRLKTEFLPVETLRDICKTVTSMDKSAGLLAKGFDFYQEALLTKQADIVSVLKVRLAGTDVPYETIQRLGKDNVSRYVGADVAKEMDGGPAHAKQVFETLPLDLQKIMLDLTKNA